MNDSHTTKNYFAHGGEELVIGGKITFLPGATVEGGEGLFDLPTGGTGSAQVPYVPDSKATSASALREDLNKLLAALRAAGILATEETVPTETKPAENESTEPNTTGDGNTGDAE